MLLLPALRQRFSYPFSFFPWEYTCYLCEDTGYLSACTVSSVKLNFFACFILKRCMRASLCKAMSNWRFNSVWRSMVYFLKLNHFVDLLPFSRLSLCSPVLKCCFRPCPISPFRTPVPFRFSSCSLRTACVRPVQPIKQPSNWHFDSVWRVTYMFLKLNYFAVFNLLDLLFAAARLPQIPILIQSGESCAPALPLSFL